MYTACGRRSRPYPVLKTPPPPDGLSSPSVPVSFQVALYIFICIYIPLVDEEAARFQFWRPPPPRTACPHPLSPFLSRWRHIYIFIFIFRLWTKKPPLISYEAPPTSPLPTITLCLRFSLQVTPSSKVVGDLAQFMVTNNLTADQVPFNRDIEVNSPNAVCLVYIGR